MKKNKKIREYIPFDPTQGWPFGDDLFYECLKCGKTLSSVIDDDCACHNLYVDFSAERMGATEPKKVRLFRVTAPSPKGEGF